MRNINQIQFILTVSLKWTLSYLFNSLKRSSGLKHIIFCMVDHFEPGTANASPTVERERMNRLLTYCPKYMKSHMDSAGNPPKRTWFFPPHYHRRDNLRKLVSLCEQGYGEIELHLHHGKTQPDTPENLKKTILQAISEYSRFGIFGISNGHKRYAFIHGDYALDNSRNGMYCGVDCEIGVLRDTGCYADFTFPSQYGANPFKINSIYYAKDDPNKPKSHNTGKRVRISRRPKGDLMIIQGPLHPFLKNGTLSGLRAWDDGLDGSPPTTKQRIDMWVRTNIHVRGKPDWIFIKTSMHGAVNAGVILESEIDSIMTFLENNYNDGEEYYLHYATAREFYNMVKSLEGNGSVINPEGYRNYEISCPEYNSRAGSSEASQKLNRLVRRTYA